MTAYLQAIARMSLITISQRFHSLWQLGSKGENWTKGIRCLICHHVTLPNGIKCLTVWHTSTYNNVHYILDCTLAEFYAWVYNMNLDSLLSSHICWISDWWLAESGLWNKFFYVSVTRSLRYASHQQCIKNRSFSHTSALVCDKIRFMYVAWPPFKVLDRCRYRCMWYAHMIFKQMVSDCLPS